MATDTSLAGQALSMTTAEIAIAVGGSVIAGARDVTVKGVSTDSRTTAKGSLFVALSGEKFDGHEFVEVAAKKGAAAALVTKARGAKLGVDIPLVAVDEKDVLSAFGRLGRAHRDKLTIPVVGITGSAGKSTAKQMTAAVLGGGKPVLKTEGNLNNRIGVPLTILSIGPRHGAAVVEMGISLPGEMAELVKIARPNVRVLLNAGISHVEFLKDADGVAAEKAHIWDEARPDDTMVFNADDPRVAREAAKRKLKNRISFGYEPGADVHAVSVQTGALGEQKITAELRGTLQEIRLKAIGDHHVMNVLAAAAAGLALHVAPDEIARGIEHRFVPMPGRGDLVRLQGDVLLIDDTYNSNPTSAAAAIAALAGAKRAGRKRVLAALGDMLELGPAGPASHAQIGKLAATSGVDAIYAFGPLSEKLAKEAKAAGLRAVKHFETRQALAEELAADLVAGDALLVKGSRGMKMDEVVAAISAARGKA